MEDCKTYRCHVEVLSGIRFHVLRSVSVSIRRPINCLRYLPLDLFSKSELDAVISLQPGTRLVCLSPVQ